jgi:hypothetical protein
MPTVERRKHARFQVKECVMKYVKAGPLSFLSKPGGQPLPVTNLSMGGLQFFATERLKPDQGLVMYLDVPALEEPLKLRGKVRWTKQVPGHKAVRTGVQFEKLPPAAQKKLELLRQDQLMRTSPRNRVLVI